MDSAAGTPPLLVVVGPTASGKSGLAIDLAERLNGEVINADSMQFYRGMDIGTAKVTDQERRSVPHHLLDTLDLSEEASVATFQQQAREKITEVRSRDKTPILVGGSGLYIRAAIDDIEFPPTDPAVRQRLQDRLEQEGAAVLRDELRRTDPESASVIRDDRRLVRALEVAEVSGRSFTSFMPQRVYHPEMTPVVQLGLNVERGLLHQRIAERVHLMREQGLLDEVTRLEQAGLREGRTAGQAIGYQQFLRVLDGALSLEQAVEETIVATRKFARRQETWFRADPRITWLQAPAEDLLDSALEAIETAGG